MVTKQWFERSFGEFFRGLGGIYFLKLKDSKYKIEGEEFDGARVQRFLKRLRDTGEYKELPENEFERPISEYLGLGMERVVIARLPDINGAWYVFKWMEYAKKELKGTRRYIEKIIHDIHTREETSVRRIIKISGQRKAAESRRNLRNLYERLWDVAQALGYYPAVEFSLPGYMGKRKPAIGAAENDRFECLRLQWVSNEQIRLIVNAIEPLRGFFRPESAQAPKGGRKTLLEDDGFMYWRYLVLFEADRALVNLYRLFGEMQRHFRMRSEKWNYSRNESIVLKYYKKKLTDWRSKWVYIRDSQAAKADARIDPIRGICQDAADVIERIAQNGFQALKRVSYEYEQGFPLTTSARNKYVGVNWPIIIKAMGFTKNKPGTVRRNMEKAIQAERNTKSGAQRLSSMITVKS